MFEFDVCIIGTGRVGLPLGLSLLDVGHSVVGVDLDEELARIVNSGKMPFREPGYDELVARREFKIQADPSVISRSKSIIITVGTPLHNHIETDLSQIINVLETLGPYLVPGQLVCLRSTLAPGTTSLARRWLERYTEHRVGEGIMLAFCPERIAEGKAFVELRTLPQIIGTEDAPSQEAAHALFSTLAPELMCTDYISAELVKLFNNISRYVNFAMANQFALVADTFGANIYEVRRMANHNYPRSFLPSPGFTAGTCLRKDFGMINEWNPYPDMLLSAWKMNEYIPTFLVQHLLKRTELHNRKVVVLGYSFKRDTDDTRDSLSPKLCRYIQRELPLELRVSDSNLADPIPDAGNGPLKNWDADEALKDADCVFVATNHTEYKDVLMRLAEVRPECWVADIWNETRLDKIFYQARDLRELKS